jgi:hypothetical protein
MNLNRENHQQHILFFAIFTAAGVLAMLLPIALSMRVFLTVIYFLGNGLLIGQLAMPWEKRIWQMLLGFLLQTAMLMILGSAVYLFFNLKPMAVLTVILLTPLVAQILALFVHRLTKKQPFAVPVINPTNPQKKRRYLSAVMGLVFAIGLIILIWFEFEILATASTELSIRSPWDEVPRLFFIIFFLITLLCLSLTIGRLVEKAILLPAMGLSLLATTVAVTVYSIGFGFDSFIHQATESHIFAYGEMTPKPFYYLGQYALVTVLARLVGGHVVTIDAWLVPTAFSLVLPLAYWSLRRSFNWSSSICAAACLPLLALPLASFIVTTPQGLANILLLLTSFVLLASAISTVVPKWIPVLLALATVTAHPLAGAPLFIFVLMIIYLDASRGLRRLPEIRWTFFIKLTILAGIALPLMFIINSRFSGAEVILDQETIRTLVAIIEELKNPELQTRRFSSTLDLVYFWRTTRTVSWATMGLAGLLLLWLMGRRIVNERQRETSIAFAAGALAFLANYILLRIWIRFPFLIEYERTNYADRLAELTLFILAPLALYTFGRLLQHLRTNWFPMLNTGLILLLAAIITANIYLAYPRRDKYESSRGWSTGNSDLKTVSAIDEDANNNYVVLANQSVAAAAIHQLGFKKYFVKEDGQRSEPIFFYPIPTGGPLYQIFLEANDNYGTREAIKPAFDLTSAETVYYVVNHYWWQAQQIIIKAKHEADTWWSIDDKIWVFKYQKASS